jgi:uncharacterized protein
VESSTVKLNSLALSTYTILSHNRFRNRNGTVLQLLLSARTGALIAITDDDATALFSGNFAAVDQRTIDSLVAAQALVSATDDEFQSLLLRNRSATQDTSRREFILLPSSYCNMGCSYCAQEHVKISPRRNHRNQIYRRVAAAMDRPETRKIDIRWFGGEPMMGYAVIIDLGGRIFDEVKSRELQYDSSMVTNGSLLTIEKLRALRHKVGVRHYAITIDGTREAHNARRPMKSGRGSYEHIVSVISEAVRNPALDDVVFEIRMNIDKDNAPLVPEALSDFKQAGLSHERVYINPKPVFTWAESTDMSERVIEWSEYARAESDWLTEMLRLGLNFRSLPRAAKPVVCEAATQASEVVSADGKIFSCTEHPLVPLEELRNTLATVDTLAPSELRPLGTHDDWNDTLEGGSTSPCRECRIFGLCGGACPRMWITGQIPCPSYKDPDNIQARLDLAAQKSGLHLVRELG